MNDPARVALATAQDASTALGVPRASGFLAGLRAFFRGVSWVMGSPSVWPLAAVPIVIAMITVAGATFAGIRIADHYVAPLAAQQGIGAVLAVVWRIFLYIVAALLALVLGFSIAQPLSAPALDALAKRRARALGITEFPDTPAFRSMMRSIRVVGLSLLVGVPLVGGLSVVTVLVPPASFVTIPAKLFVAAVLAAWDIFDTPFGLAGLGVRARIAWMRANFAASVALGLVFAVVALVPGLGLFLIPMAVAGATDLWAASRRSV